MTTTVLIVDDDPVQRRLAEAAVRRFGFNAKVAENGADGLALLRSEGADVVLLDLVMPGLDGLGVLGEMRKSGLDTPVIVQTSNGSIDAVVNAMRAGAVDFVVKPAGAERLQVSIKNALRVDHLEEEVRRMRRRASGSLSFKDLTSKSPDMERLIRLAERSAKSNIPVLIEGESGVGKEVLARAIQGSGERRGKAFITVNCGAIPENLVESTLFGHEKGAFTGATEKHAGKFVEASGGTLFLDEIGELPLDAQVKLLRALQEGEVDPVGGKRAVRVDIRLISATNRSLLDLVKLGKFREDLYYRLNVFPMTLPPLRARREDIPDLVRSFCARFSAEEGKRIRAIASEAMALLTRYPLARQRPPIGERPVPRGRARRRRRADGGGVPADRRAGRGLRRAYPRSPGAGDDAGLRPRAGARDRPGRGARSPRHDAGHRGDRRDEDHGRAGDRDHPLRPAILPGADVGSLAPSRDRAIDTLSQTQGPRPGERGQGGGCGLISARGAPTHRARRSELSRDSSDIDRAGADFGKWKLWIPSPRTPFSAVQQMSDERGLALLKATLERIITIVACGCVAASREMTMRVPRPSLVALAALMTGTFAVPVALHAQAPAKAAIDATAPATDAAPSDPVSAALPDYKPETAPVETAKPPVAAAPVAPSDPQGAAVFARLAETVPLIARSNAKEREALRAFYEARGYKPLWIADGVWTEAAKAVSARLSAAGEDALDPRAYPVPALPGNPDAKAIADADLRLSAAAALYARDARGGRINLASISRLITPTLDLPAPDAVLAKLGDAGAKAGDALQAYNPGTRGYRGLKGRLAALRGPVPGTLKPLRLPAGPALRLGMRDPRVPLLRAYFGLENRAAGTLDDAPGEPEDYDAGVAAAVSKFQRERGFPGNGVLNVQTVLALADAGRPVRASGNEAELIVNMERWRWLPGDLGSDYILVNVPEYRVRIFRAGTLRDEARVIVGKPESRTPIFSGLMEYAVVNPSWYVPPSILKTMAPRLAGYGGKTWGGYEVVRHGGHVSLRQPPGERNALGHIKFMFPNQHAVYLHDTPNRSLFSAAKRDFSHGCVRVDDPFRFADAVLPNWSEDRLKKLIGKGERTIRLPEKLPVHLAYFTATADESGSVRTLPDLYGYDAPMRAALGLSGAGGPAMARLPAEPARRAGETRHAPAPVAAVERPRPVAHARPVRRQEAPTVSRRAAYERPARRYEAEPPVRMPRRAARADGAPEYGEPGLWTPPPPGAPRSFW